MNFNEIQCVRGSEPEPSSHPTSQPASQPASQPDEPPATTPSWIYPTNSPSALSNLNTCISESSRIKWRRDDVDDWHRRRFSANARIRSSRAEIERTIKQRRMADIMEYYIRWNRAFAPWSLYHWMGKFSYQINNKNLILRAIAISSLDRYERHCSCENLISRYGKCSLSSAEAARSKLHEITVYDRVSRFLI